MMPIKCDCFSLGLCLFIFQSKYCFIHMPSFFIFILLFCKCHNKICVSHCLSIPCNFILNLLPFYKLNFVYFFIILINCYNTCFPKFYPLFTHWKVQGYILHFVKERRNRKFSFQRHIFCHVLFKTLSFFYIYVFECEYHWHYLLCFTLIFVPKKVKYLSVNQWLFLFFIFFYFFYMYLYWINCYNICCFMA